ncbi:MAG TPA: response regulator [Thermoanaerobaculia bacterium]
MRMLVVDDEDVITFACRSYFTLTGFEVDTASRRDEAIELLSTRTYDVLIADVRLTGSEEAEGLEVVRFARGQSETMVIVVLTAYRASAVQADARGADVLLQKPKRLPEIAATVNELLGARR